MKTITANKVKDGFLNFKMKICEICGKEFIPTGKCQKYCKKCQHTARLKKRRNSDKHWRLLHPKYKRQYMKTLNGKIAQNKINSRRRELDFISLNEFKEGCEAHHLDKVYVIYISEEVHRSIYHCLETGRGMAEMNALAMNYL